MHDFIALFRQIAREHVAAGVAFAEAEVVSYDKDANTAVVEFKPQGVRSGDIRIYTPWAGTPGKKSGMQAGLEAGTLVKVVAFDTEWEDLGIMLTSYSDKNKAPGAPGGEWWVVHGDGESYVKLQNSGKTLVGGKVEVDLIAPLVQLTNTMDALGPEKALVRKEDLQTLIDWINNSLIPWIKGHTHVGNLGFPTSNPVTAALLLDKSAATASPGARAR